MTDTQVAQTFTQPKADPFNYPALQRNDLMSLSTINQFKDGMNTSTKRFQTGRDFSMSLNTRDIDGKLSIIKTVAQVPPQNSTDQGRSRKIKSNST